MQYRALDKVVDRLLIFMLVMSTGGMLFVLNRNIASITFFVLLVFVLVFFGFRLKKLVFSPVVLTFVSLVLLGCINYFFAAVEQSANKYGFHLLTVVISVLTVLHFQNNRENRAFIKGLYFVLKLILFHSVVSFAIYFFVKDNLSIVTSNYHEYDTFRSLFFYSTEKGIIDLFGMDFCRNQGLFWEPGVLQGYLNLLFFIEAFIIKRSKSMLFLTSFMILTTYSTTGLALLFLQAIIYIKNEFKINIATFLIIVVGVPLYILFTVNMNEKMYGEGESSFQKRLFDLTQPLFIAFEYPLTGIGMDVEQFQHMRTEFYFSSNTLKGFQEQIGIKSKVDATDKGSSNSVMFLFASMGFPTTILFLVMLFRQNLIKEKRNLFIFMVLILVMSSPLLLRPFFFMLIASGFFSYFTRITSYRKKLV